MGDKVIPVKVAVRCRPLIQKEEKDGCQCCLQFVPGEPQLIVGKDKAFTFDYVFDANIDQLTVYQESVQPLVKGLFKGYNATVLAYGQTGSGKTYSMGGGYGVSLETDEETVGIIPRVIRDLFNGIKDLQQKYQIDVRVSYLELYKDDLFDLFVPVAKREKDQVQIVQDNIGGIKLTGMSELDVKSFEDTMNYLEEGSQSRTVGATAMNNQSSRSHAIFTVHLDRKSLIDSQDFCKAKFHLVDLAGSERIKKTHAEGERLKEGININKGLLVLGNVISALGDDSLKRGHIPYRDSKLTRLLQDSLGGNSHTLMVACVSPADSNIEETINTLRYADRARKIKNKPVVNRDPQAAEIIRLRQLVQDMQSQGLKVPIDKVESGRKDDYCALIEKTRKLEEDKLQLVNELQVAVCQNTEMMEKVIRAEMARDCLKEKLNELRETTTIGMNHLLDSSKLKEDQDMTQIEGQLNLVKQVQEKLLQIENEVDDKNSNDHAIDEENDNGENDDEEMRSRHVLKQAQMNRELKELNTRLQKTQELACQMQSNDKEMQEMREKYEQQVKEMEQEIEKYQKEKDDLVSQVHSARSVTNNNKVAEQRRKRIQELEGQIQQLKKKMTEQMKMLKMKEQTDKRVENLNQEIMNIKQQRVKLMNQIKDDAEQFRKMKAEMTKEVLQLKSQDRKRLAEMAKLQRQHQNQQIVLKRKAEEAAAANNRLKEVLMRQKMVADDRSRKQDNADATSVGSRIKKIVSDEMELLVTVEEARIQLNEQMDSRKEMNKQVQKIRDALGDSEKENLSEEEILALKSQVKDLDQQIDLCNVQITDLQQKLLDADHDEKSKSRWDNIHTMMEAKCAIKWLLQTAVNVKVDSDKKEGQINDLRCQWNDLSRSMQQVEEDSKKVKEYCLQERYNLQKEHETKILYLLSQMKNPINSTNVNESDKVKELQKKISFMNEEIQKFVRLEEELSRKTEEYESLKKEFTKAQYKKTTGLSGSLLPSPSDSTMKSLELENNRSEFFNKIICPKQKRKRVTQVEAIYGQGELSESEDDYKDDLKNDPTYKSGLTPAPTKIKSRFSKNEAISLNQTYVAGQQGKEEESVESRETRKRISDKTKRRTTRTSKETSPNDSNDDNESIISKLDKGIGSKKRKLQPVQPQSFFSSISG